MTRREFVSTVALPVFASNSPASLVVPVHQVIDTRARITPEQLQRFSSIIWPEAVQDFQRCGIQLRTTQESLAIRRSPGGRPVFSGLKHGVINFFITDNIPMDWDNGRGLAGVTTSYEGYHLCMIALNYAHGHQIPFFSVNTCVHELLHVLLGDVYESRPKGLSGAGREFRIDSYATRLWLFHDGSTIRQAAQAYLDHGIATTPFQKRWQIQPTPCRWLR